MIGNPFHNAFGLDISDLSIKLVQLKNTSFRHRKPTYELQHVRSTTLPHGLIVNGVLQEPETVRKYISHLLHDKKGKRLIQGQWVATNVPEVKSFLKHITINKPLDDIIDEDIDIATKKHIPFDRETSYIDWQVIPQQSRDTDSTHVLVAVTEKPVADSYTYLLESLGLMVMAVEIESLSIARSIVPIVDTKADQAVAIFDIGASRSTLVIYDNQTVQFSKIFPLSGEQLTTAIAQQRKMPYEDAEKIKKKCGFVYNKTCPDVFGIMQQELDPVFDMLEKSFRYYESHVTQANPIASLIICGGGANMKGLSQALTERLKLPVTLGDPWQNLSGSKKNPVSKEKSQSYASAIGLALRAADNPFMKGDII